MQTHDAITIQAFSLARLQLDTALSEDLQQTIHKLGNAVAQHQSGVAEEVRKLVTQHGCLQEAFKSAYEELHRQYQLQDQLSSSIAPNPLSVNWEEISIQILVSDEPIVVVKQLLRRLQYQSTGRTSSLVTQDAYLTSLQRLVARLDAQSIAVLEALEKRPLTLRDLMHRLGGSVAQVTAIVQALWHEGYIDCANGRVLAKILPMLRDRTRSQEIDPDAYLTITSKGHFYLHPIVTLGQRGTTAR